MRATERVAAPEVGANLDRRCQALLAGYLLLPTPLLLSPFVSALNHPPFQDHSCQRG